MATIQIPKKVVTESIETIDVELPYFTKTQSGRQFFKVYSPERAVWVMTGEGNEDITTCTIPCATEKTIPITREEFEEAASKVLHKLSGLIIND
jgi:hypothetical protein